MTTTTKALSKLVTQRQTAAGMLIEIGGDGTADLTRIDNLEEIYEVGGRELQTTGSLTEIRTSVIDELATSLKWPGEDVIRDPDKFLRRMIITLQRAAFPAVVLREATERLIATEKWIPETATVLAACREVVAEAERGLRRARHHLDALEAPLRELQREIAAAALDIEDEADPSADFRRWLDKRSILRPIEQRQRIEEITADIRWIEEKQRQLDGMVFRPGERAAADRIARKLSDGLATRRAELASVEAELL